MGNNFNQRAKLWTIEAHQIEARILAAIAISNHIFRFFLEKRFEELPTSLTLVNTLPNQFTVLSNSQNQFSFQLNDLPQQISIIITKLSSYDQLFWDLQYYYEQINSSIISIKNVLSNLLNDDSKKIKS
jgi:hypothetical protein